MRYFTSDTHFGHANIIKYCNRPFKDVPHMNEMLIQNWNSVVGPDDEVVHLGDVALGPWSEWDGLLTRLNGFKTLVVGNHDRVFKGESLAKRERFEPYYAGWFDVVTDNVSGFPVMGEDEHVRFVNLSHFPYEGDSHDGDRYEEFRLPDNGRPLIHGHTHDANQHATVSSKGTPMFHVGVDAHNYAPVPETVIADWLVSLDG